MTRVIYPNAQSLGGPWLIDRAALDQLDCIANEAWNLMTDARQRDMERETEEELKALDKDSTAKDREYITERVRNRYHYTTEKRNVILSTRSLKTIEASTIHEAIDDVAVKDESVEALELSNRCGDYSIDVTMGNYNGNNLRFSVSPIDTPFGSQIFSKLDRWVSALKPPAWKRLWRTMHGFQWILLMIVAVGGAQMVPSRSATYKSVLSKKADVLVTTGVTSSNLPEAVSLLLAQNIGYYPDNYKIDTSSFQRKFFTTICIVFIVCLVLSFPPPRLLLGVGRDEKLIPTVRWWARFVSVSIPSLVFASILWPSVISILKSIYNP